MSRKIAAAVEGKALRLARRPAAIDHEVEIAARPAQEPAAAMPFAAEIEGFERPVQAFGRSFLEIQLHAVAGDKRDGPVIAGKEGEVARGRDFGQAEPPEKILGLSGLARDLMGHTLAVLPGHGPEFPGRDPHLVPKSRAPRPAVTAGFLPAMPSACNGRKRSFRCARRSEEDRAH